MSRIALGRLFVVAIAVFFGVVTASGAGAGAASAATPAAESSRHGPIGPLYGTITFRWNVDDFNSGTDYDQEGRARWDWKETYHAGIEVAISLNGKAGEQRGKASDRLQVIFAAGSATSSYDEHYHIDKIPRPNGDPASENQPEWEDIKVSAGRGPAKFGTTEADSRCSAHWQGWEGEYVALDCLAFGMTVHYQRSNSKTGTEPEVEVPWWLAVPGSAQEGLDSLGSIRVKPEIRGDTIRLHQTFIEDTVGMWQGSHAALTVQSPISMSQYDRALSALPPQYAEAMKQALQQANASAREQQTKLPQRGKDKFGYGGPFEGKMTVSYDLTTSTLEADPGGPYEVERAEWVTLDGSKSKGEIDTYEWTFEPDPDESEPPPVAEMDGASLDGRIGGPSPYPFNAAAGGKVATKYGKEVKAQAIAGFTATLKVKSKGRSHSKSVHIKVGARKWHTPVDFKAEWNYPTVWTAPQGRWIDKRTGKYWKENTQDGENVCAEEDPHLNATQASGILHPHGGMGHDNWLDNGYKLARCDDPNGPWDGEWFVLSSELVANRAGIFNQWIKLGAPAPTGSKVNMATANKERGIEWQEYLDAVEAHEGWGKKGIGHTRLIKNAIKARDPREKIEKLHQPDKDALKNAANTVIRDIDKKLAVLAGDEPPLTGNWDGPYFMFFFDVGDWVKVSESF